MGIFSRANKQPESKTSTTTIISQGTFVRGGIETAGSVFIDGKFEGAIIAGESLIVGQHGEVIGDIKAKSLTVSGVLDGLIDVEEVNILESGRILGKMQYQHLEIERNGVFEGEGKMKNSTSVSQYSKVEDKNPQELIEEA